ncbi:MAG: DUF58 domain-containing protein [Bryobacteraceae bacterium]
MVPSVRLLWIAGAAVIPASAIAGLVPAARPFAFALAVTFALAAVIDAWLSRDLPKRIRVEAESPLRTYKDRAAIVRVVCRGGAGERVRLGIAWPESLQAEFDEQAAVIPATGAAEISWPITPSRRGAYLIDTVHVETPSRLGLWDVRSSVKVKLEVEVFPSLWETEDVLALRRNTLGSFSQRQVGKGREFEKLREYLPGDGFDEIHWKATARRARPVTKVFQVERTREVYIAIDASRLSGRAAERETRLERYIATALVMSAAAERHGDLFGLITFQDRVVDFIRAGKGSPHRAACRKALQRIHTRSTAPDFGEVATQLRLQLRGRALILFLTDLDDTVAAREFADASRFLAHKHLVAAAMIRPAVAMPVFQGNAETEEEIYQRMGGHLVWKGLKTTESALRRAGIRFGVFEEKTLSAEVAALYGDIKQRQLL